MKIVFASNNLGKINELSQLVSRFSIQVIPQAKLGVDEVPETGLTFVENALIKARHAAKISGLPAIADDSGLIVNTLNGAPGLYSARYAGEKANTHDNIQKLLSELKNHSDRKAFFYCVLVFLKSFDDPAPIISEGKWHGEILMSPQGEHGFGYDPVFLDPYEKLSAAEISPERKNQISHRGQALHNLIGKLC